MNTQTQLRNLIIALTVFQAATSFAGDEHADHRTLINADSQAKEHVLLEMRELLETVQLVLDGALKKDMEKVATHAEKVGLKAMRATPPAVANQLPKEFKMMGRSVHEAMDTIARDARDLGDSTHTLEQLNTTLQTCVACHATYKLQ